MDATPSTSRVDAGEAAGRLEMFAWRVEREHLPAPSS
jgi:hypothetical protein